MMPETVYQYIKQETERFETEEIRVGDNWMWNFKNHVQLIFHLKHGIFYTGENDWLRAFKNLMRPVLNLNYWTEDIEVKDVLFFIEKKAGRVLSFLIKKYHDEVYVKEHDIDSLFDEVTENDIDFGGVFVHKGAKRPETLPLTKVAFCDQTDALGAPISFRHNFAPETLRKYKNYGWGDKNNGATVTIEELITLASNEKQPDGDLNTKTNYTPGKNIEVYITKGTLPAKYLGEDSDEWVYQTRVDAFYTKEDGVKEGVTLYARKTKKVDIKFFSSKKIENRALGESTGEALLHPQIWTNFLTIHKMKMLEAGSKSLLWTNDDDISKNQVQDMDNLEVLKLKDNGVIGQVPTVAVSNIQLYEKAINEWYEHAQLEGAAFDPILGKEANSGTTFRGQERTVAQGRGYHDRRRGKRAKFLEEIYRDMIIPDIKNEIVSGKKFLSTLSNEEMTWVTEQMAENYAEKKLMDDMFNGIVGVEEDREKYKTEFKTQFAKEGGRYLIEILKDEMRDIEIGIGINIAAKQKDLVNLSDKLLSVFQFVFANPQGFREAMQIPALANTFQEILEFSGINQSIFASLLNMPAPQQPQMQPQQPRPQLTLNQPVAQ